MERLYEDIKKGDKSKNCSSLNIIAQLEGKENLKEIKDRQYSKFRKTVQNFMPR